MSDRTISLFSDAELLKIARSSMAKAKQRRLERLVDLKKQQRLTETERVELEQLFDEAQHVMLRKAEVFCLLARRGYKIFSSTANLAV